MRLCKMLCAVAGAVLVAAMCVPTASARQFNLSERDIRATFPTFEITGPIGSVRCPLTLEIRMHERRITKLVELLIGEVTAAALGVCPAGRAGIQVESLPWHVRYASFAGTLPNITSFTTKIVGMEWNITEPTFMLRCLIRTTAGEPVTLIFTRENSGALVQARLGGEILTGTECSRIRARVTATSNALTVLGGGAAVTLTLI